MNSDVFKMPIAAHIWDSKYRYRDASHVYDASVADTWQRVADALAVPEGDARARWSQRFYEVLEDFRFLPGGRIIAGAGTGHRVTLFNCFVMGVIEDSMDGIFAGLREGALTMQQGGGVGYDFSSLRPAGMAARTTGTLASGPVSFMQIWDSMCGTLLSTGARRGAMMATLRCDHPDIETFIEAKQDGHSLRHFNLSVQVSDEFMDAVRADDDWALVFPVHDSVDLGPASGDSVLRRWPGHPHAVRCRVIRTVRARRLWDKIMHATYDYSEPGVLFVDRINRMNNLAYREYITATNPCGEIPLPPYGACNLGSVNLTRFVLEPFTARARLDEESVARTAATATRLLDNVIDRSRFPSDKQAAQARGTRRIGLGLTGLGDALIMLGLHYDSDEARAIAAHTMRTICLAAYRTSTELAREKGPFPFFEPAAYLAGEFIGTLPADVRDAIASNGIRNSHLTAIAPAGTISLLANNISSGIEPVFDFRHTRRVLQGDGSYATHTVTDFARQVWDETGGGVKLPPEFVSALELSPEAHLAMQAALQPYVDNAISKTINVPASFAFDEFRSLYEHAYSIGAKGCTTFRPNALTDAILKPASADEEEGMYASHCCNIEREAD